MCLPCAVSDTFTSPLATHNNSLRRGCPHDLGCRSHESSDLAYLQNREGGRPDFVGPVYTISNPPKTEMVPMNKVGSHFPICPVYITMEGCHMDLVSAGKAPPRLSTASVCDDAGTVDPFSRVKCRDPCSSDAAEGMALFGPTLV